MKNINKTIIKLNKIKHKLNKIINLGYLYGKERIYPGEFLNSSQLKTILENLNNNKDWNDYLGIKSEFLLKETLYLNDVETYDGTEYLTAVIVAELPDNVRFTGYRMMIKSKLVISIYSNLNVDFYWILPHHKNNSKEEILSGRTTTLPIKGVLNINTLEIELEESYE